MKDPIVGGVRRELGNILLLILLTLADSLINSFFPLMMSRFVNGAMSAGDRSWILQIGAELAGLVLLDLALGIVLVRLLTGICQRYAHGMRTAVFDHLLTLSVRQVSRFPEGRLLTLVTSDTELVSQFVAQVLMLLLRPLMLIGIGVGMLLRLNPPLIGAVFVSLPIQVLILLLTMRRMIPAFARTQKGMERLAGHLREALAGMRLIRLSRKEDAESGRLKKDHGELYTENLLIQRTVAWMNPLMMLQMDFSLLLVLVIFSRLFSDARAEGMGDVMAGMAFVQQILMSLMMLAQLFPGYSRARVSGRRLRELLAMETDLPGGEESLPAGALALSLEHASWRSDENSPPAISDVCLTVAPGERVAVVGPTGSGKSLLLKLMCRLVDPSEGTVRINGTDLRRFSLTDLRRRVIPVMQYDAVEEATLADNIRYGMPAEAAEVERVARLCQLGGLLEEREEGLDALLYSDGCSLSGGQKQCLSIARAVLRRPDVLIMDESTAHLDLETENNLFREIRRELPGTTLIVCSQRIHALTRFDRIIVMDGGRVLAAGTHEELMESSPIYREIYASQLREGGAA
mgnify:CR=1 FL=1